MKWQIAGAKAENCKLKGLWAENYKEISAALDKLKKEKRIDVPKTKRETN